MQNALSNSLVANDAKTNGANGTSASLFGNGGHGGQGGDGGSLETTLIKTTGTASLTGDATLIAKAGSGSNGGNGGQADGPDHEWAIKHGLYTGNGGNGGDGGLVILTGYKAQAGGDVNVSAMNFNITGQAGHGGQGGSAGDNTKAEGGKDFNLRPENAGQNDIYAQNVHKGHDGQNGTDGSAYVVGLEISDATINVSGVGTNTIKVTAQGAGQSEAYSLMAQNGTQINVSADLSLETTVTDIDGKNGKTGQGFVLADSSINFDAMDGIDYYQSPSNSSFRAYAAPTVGTRQNFNTITTDKLTLQGQNNMTFYTDVQNKDGKGTGDKVVVTKEVDFTKLDANNGLSIKIGSDAGIGRLEDIDFEQTVESKGQHVLVDLSKATGNKTLSQEQMSALNNEWFVDYGAVKYEWKADITQNAANGNIILNGLAVTNKNAANVAVLSLDNAFLINRMSFLADSQLSERFRLIKNDGLTQARSGLWYQTYTADVDFNTKAMGNVNINTNFTMTKIGFNHVTHNEDLDVMRGAYAGYGLMTANYDRHMGNSKIKNTNFGLYCALAYHSGVYVEGNVDFNFYNSDLSAYEDCSNAVIDASYNTNSFGASLALGKKMTLPYNLLVDNNIKLDYTYYAGKNFTTSSGLDVAQDNYFFVGAIASTLLGKYLNDDKTLVYAKLDAGYYISSEDGIGQVTDLHNGRVNQFETPEYNLYFGNAVLGIKHRVQDKVELSLEANRYILSGVNDFNTGVRGEVRYLF